MSAIDLLPLRRKLLLLVGLPLVVLTAAALLSALAAWSQKSHATRAANAADIAVAIGDLLHQTQRERGGSSVFLSSSGASFSTELPAQHRSTDEAAAAFRATVAENRGGVAASLVSSLDEVLLLLDEIPQVRSEVLGLERELAPTLAWYTNLNATMLQTIRVVESESEFAELGRSTTAYRSILSGKEAAGITRAQLANAFTADRFSPGQLPTVVSLVTRQREYIGQFVGLTTPDLADAHAEWAQLESTSLVEVLEQEAIANGVGGFGIDPVAWFEAKTEYIDGLKAIEDSQAASLADEAHAERRSAILRFWAIVATGLASLGTTCFLGLRVVASIERPLHRIGDQARTIASGRLDVEPLAMAGEDEIAVLAGVFDDMAERLSLHAFQTADSLERMDELAAELLTNADTLTAASAELTGGAEATATRASSVSAASTQASTLTQSVSAAVEQLQSSVDDVSSNADRATDTAARAAAVAKRSKELIGKLGTSSDEISRVVDEIESIAGDTNMLALNATIEAARAGEAGKGFGVVANEVKALAQQTSDATESIRQRVERIQAEVRRAVDAMEEVADVVETISDGQAAVSASVGEQNKSTAAIVSAITDVASTSEVISTDIKAVAAASEQTSVHAAETRRAAQEVMRLASRLNSASEHTDALVDA